MLVVMSQNGEGIAHKYINLVMNKYCNMILFCFDT